MCRSIKVLREKDVITASDAEITAAALQYVRKISGYRAPSRANEAAFNLAVEDISAASKKLLESLQYGTRV